MRHVQSKLSSGEVKMSHCDDTRNAKGKINCNSDNEFVLSHPNFSSTDTVPARYWLLLKLSY